MKIKKGNRLTLALFSFSVEYHKKLQPIAHCAVCTTPTHTVIALANDCEFFYLCYSFGRRKRIYLRTNI